VIQVDYSTTPNGEFNGDKVDLSIRRRYISRNGEMAEIMNQCPCEIVPAAEPDLPEILRLQHLAYRSEAELFSNPDIPPLRQTLADLREECRRGANVLKAVDADGAIVGSVRFRCDGRTVRIGKLVVRPDRQGCGIGARLLLETERCCPGSRFELFTSSRSVRNLAWYERLGYRKFREQEVSEELHLIYLEKNPAPSPTGGEKK